jgi:hypothetical protein
VERDSYAAKLDEYEQVAAEIAAASNDATLFGPTDMDGMGMVVGSPQLEARVGELEQVRNRVGFVFTDIRWVSALASKT